MIPLGVLLSAFEAAFLGGAAFEHFEGEVTREGEVFRRMRRRRLRPVAGCMENGRLRLVISTALSLARGSR